MQKDEYDRLTRAEMEAAVRSWLHNDPEIIRGIDVPAVADSLLQNEVRPDEVNTSDRYDLVNETVEMFDSRADER